MPFHAGVSRGAFGRHVIGAGLAAGLMAFAVQAQAQDVIARYTAFIGTDDLYSSKGERLYEPWQILRQDRTNFHRFGLSQPGDEGDPFFNDADNRARMERLTTQGNIDPQARSAILAGGATVIVTLWGAGRVATYVDVDVAR
jgi:hypothetical protein